MNRLIDRRRFFQSVASTAIAGGLGLSWAEAAEPKTTPQRIPSASYKPNPFAAKLPIWQLARPKAALPNSYFWTWDRRCNWMRDDPGMIDYGSNGIYLKKPETFVEDYRRLTDFSAGLGVKGITIWGFLRDNHGGIDAAKRVIDYANSKNVAIMPGIGTNAYGGVYYRGDHPYNMETFLKKHPEVASVSTHKGHCAVCPSHPRFQDWIREGIQWLFKEFEIGGANLENGDRGLCNCPRCKKLRAEAPKGEVPFWQDQYLGYAPALEVLKPHLKEKLIVWATYQGFLPGTAPTKQDKYAFLGESKPRVFDRLPREAIAQWNMSWMMRKKPLPLTAYLDDGAPHKALNHDLWKEGAKPPVPRNVAYVTRGMLSDRCRTHISHIKEACLCGYRAGLEGISMYGEVSSTIVPYALNYLAFSHFIHWPEDTMRQFGVKTLGQVLGSEEEGEAFTEYLSHWDARSLSDAQKKDAFKRAAALKDQVRYQGKGLDRWRFWNWLTLMMKGWVEPETVSIT
ncbi:MAG: hypothetical protein JXM70_01300 [Pirellulales bacterium]|nr:hypothetical protein [Pirellulales bacterium]